MRDAAHEAAHQHELERRRSEEDALLRADSDYEKWLDQFNDRKVTHEISRER